MKTKFSLILALLAFQSSPSFGQTSAVPGSISYQGKVLNAAGALVGSGTPVSRTVIFRVWDHPSNTQAANLLYSESQTVVISEGEFSVLIGTGVDNTTSTFSYPETSKGPTTVNIGNVFNGSLRFLGVTVAAAASIATTDNEISPRQQIVSAAFAHRAKFAETLGTSTSGNSMTVLDNGNVGVGNASPPSIFTVTGANSSNAAAPQLLITATDTTERLRLGVNDIGNGTGFIQAFKEGSGAQNLTLNSEGGNVGIGTNAPGNQLTVQRTMGSNDTVVGQHSYQFQIQNGIGARSLGIGVLDNGRAVVQAKESNVGYNDLLLNPVGGRVGIGSEDSSQGILSVGGMITSVGTGRNGSPGYLRMSYDDGRAVFDVVNPGLNGPLTRGFSYDGDNNLDWLSDRTLKTNIVEAEPMLDRLLQLPFHRYHWKDSAEGNAVDGNDKEFGVIAQEVEPLFPDLIGRREDGKLTVGYTSFATIACKSIQELNKKMEDKIAQLETELSEKEEAAAALEARLSALEKLVNSSR